MKMRTFVASVALAFFSLSLVLAFQASNKEQDDADSRMTEQLRRYGYVGDLAKEYKSRIADTSEANYRKALADNARTPGTVSDAEVARLYREYSESVFLSLRQEINTLQREVKELRSAVKDLSTTKIRPL